MKVRFPLYLQTIGFLLLHLGVLSLLFLLFFNTQFGMGWEALMSSPVGERVESVSLVLRQQLRSRPASSWNEILASFGKLYGVQFYLFDRHGRQVAGDQVSLPEAVATHVIRHRGQFTGEFNRAMLPDGSQAPGDNSARVRDLRDRLPHGRFLIHTSNPEQFWICMRFGIPAAATAADAISVPDGHALPGTLIAACPSLWSSRILFDFRILLEAVGGVLVFSILLWWPFVYSITRAVSQVTAVTERIAEGHFDTRLKVKRPDEIGRLADAVNSMAERLESFVLGQKRFLGDTAHELCSPVSRLQVALELLESTGQADQEQTIRDIREDVVEISTLINELLAFSKAGLQGKEIQLSPVNIDALLKAVVQKSSCESLVDLEVQQEICAMADQLLLERALGNVMRNAVRYASADGPISVKAQRIAEQVVITVTDSGPGVPAEALKMLGQPFFRPEPSRSRNSGGVGLGLAIVKTCVEACGGSFKVSNNQPRGLQVELRLVLYVPPVLSGAVGAGRPT